MFWGLIMEPKRRYTQVVKRPFHISMAALDIFSADEEPTQVMLYFEERNYLLCTLHKGQMLQCPLDLNFETGDEVVFATNGNSNIHLSGYIQDQFDEFLDEGEEEQEEEEEEVEEEVEEGKNKRNRKKKLKEKDEKQPPNKKSKLADLLHEEFDSNDDDESFVLNEALEDDEDDEDEEMEDEASSLSGDEEDDDEEDEDQDEEEEEEVKKPVKQMNGDKAKPQKKKQQQQQQNVSRQETTPKSEKKKLEKTPKSAKNQKTESPGQQKKTLEGGVVIQDLKVGDGNIAKPGRLVQVHYEGRLKQNNKLFDQSNKGAGFKFRLGKQEVIKGWDIGIAGMKIGGRRRIICPPPMAYGQKGSLPAIPPNSTLVFEVELKNII